jgi:hypothetical protein
VCRADVIDLPEVVLQRRQLLHKDLHLVLVQEALKELDRVAQLLRSLCR